MARPSLLPRGDAQVYRAARCETWIWTPSPGILVTEVAGDLTVGAAAALSAALRRMVVNGPRVHVFHDWEEMTDYAPAARVELTEVGKEFTKQIAMSNILLRSKIVALAVQAASLLVPNIRVHLSRHSLDAALRQAMPSGPSPSASPKPR